MVSARSATLRAAGPGLRRTMRRFRPHLRAERRLLGAGLIALLAEVAMRLLEPWPLKFVIDGVIGSVGDGTGGAQPAGLQAVLILASVVLVMVVGFRALASYLMTICFALAGNRVLTRVRADLYEHLHALSLTFHENARTGDLVTRLTGDVGRLKEVAVTAALPLAGNTITLIGMTAVVAVLDWQLALITLAVFPIFFLVSLRVTKRINSVSRTQRRAEGALASLATETLSSMRVVQSYSLEQHMQNRFSANNIKTLRDGVQAKKLSAGLERRTDVLVGLATGVVLFVGAQRVLLGALTPGELVVFLTYLKAAFKPMRDVAKYTGRIAAAAASGERIVQVLDQQPTILDRSWTRPAGRFRGDVSFDDVWFAYQPGHPVLRGLHLHIRAGERVAIVGPSGAGKSSIAMLLSRLRDPDRGRVRIDGHEITDLTVDSVRRQIAVVLQDSVLFATTVAENISYGRADATGEMVRSAAALAGAHDFIMALPHGYDTVIGERGETLSGGQRQRIAIARAALRDAPIVVLDEAMTGLDSDTEREVLAALRRLTADRTTLVITHDRTAALDADRVIWLDAGQVLDEGRPDEVLTRCGKGIQDARTG